MKKVLSYVLVLSLIASFFVGCGNNNNDANQSSQPADQSSTESTGQDNSQEKRTDLELTVYSCMLEDYMVAALEKFQADTGVKTQGVRLGVGETLAKLRTEKDNPQASIWFGGAAETFIAAKEDGLLETYISPNATDIPEQYKDPEGYWTGFYQGYLGFAYNKDLLEEAGLPVPTKWEDLLDERYEGMISMANPASSGTSYNLLATLAQVMGEDEAIEYLTKLDKNIRQYEKSGTAPGRMVGQSEAILGITFLHDALKYKEEGFNAIEVVTPDSGTGYELGCVSIIKGGADQEAAKMFIDWLLKPENLELGQQNGSYQFLTNPNAKSPEIAESIKDAKLIDFDYKYAGENRDRLVELWAAAVNR